MGLGFLIQVYNVTNYHVGKSGKQVIFKSCDAQPVEYINYTKDHSHGPTRR